MTLTKLTPRTIEEFIAEVSINVDLPNDCIDEGFQIMSPEPYPKKSTNSKEHQTIWELGGKKLALYFVKYDRTLVLSEMQTEFLRELNNIKEFNLAYNEDLGLKFTGEPNNPQYPYLIEFETEKEVSLKTFFKYCLYTSQKKGMIPESYFRKLHLVYFALNKIEEFKSSSEKQFGNEYMDIPRLHHKINSFIMDNSLAKNLTNAEKELKDYYYQWAGIFTKQALLIHYNHYEHFVELKTKKEKDKNAPKSYKDAKLKDPLNHQLEMPSRKADLNKDFYKRFKINPEDIAQTAQKNKKRGVGIRKKTKWGHMENA